MFMERKELKYGVKLGKMQLRLVSASFITMTMIFFINEFFNGAMGALLSMLFLEAEYGYSLTIISTPLISFVVYLAIGLIVWNSSYRKRRISQEIYPQTNKSRFVANVLGEYVFVVVMTLCVLVLTTLLAYVLPVIVAHTENSVLVGRLTGTDILITGIVTLVLGLLIQSVVLFIASAIRKFKIWCFIVPAICVVWVRMDLTSFWNFVEMIWSFYFDESSLFMFICKVLITHLILNVASYILEIYTEFYVQGMSKKKKILLVVTFIMIPIICMIGVGEMSISIGEATYEESVEVNLEEVTGEEENQIVIDVSHLEPGTVIQVEASGNVTLPDESGNKEYDYDDGLYVSYMDDLVVDGDTLILEYVPGVSVEQGLDIYPYLEPEFQYELEGNVLKLSYELMNKNIQIVQITNPLAYKYNANSEVSSGGWGVYSYYSYSPAMLYIVTK